MYKKPKYLKTQIACNNLVEGETIERKVSRLLNNKEPIKDGAPLIYTERKEGVLSAYNIRTDRWEIAADAMDVVHRSTIAKRDSKPEGEKVIEMKPDGEAESTQGKTSN